MYFLFNIAKTEYPIKWNVYLIGINETTFLRKVLNLRKPLASNPNKSLFKGNIKNCKKWIKDFNDKSISEQLDLIEALHNATLSKEINDPIKKIKPASTKQIFVSSQSNKWKSRLREIFRKALKAKKITPNLLNEYNKIIQLNQPEGKAQIWIEKMQKILEPKGKKRKRTKKGNSKFHEISTPIGGQPGYKLNHHYK